MKIDNIFGAQKQGPGFVQYVKFNCFCVSVTMHSTYMSNHHHFQPPILCNMHNKIVKNKILQNPW